MILTSQVIDLNYLEFAAVCLISFVFGIMFTRIVDYFLEKKESAK